MLQQLTLNYAAGQVLWAYHTLMLIIFLLDPRLSGAAPQPDPSLDPNAAAKAALGFEGLAQLVDLVIEAEEEEHRQTAKQTRQAWDSDSDSDPDAESPSVGQTAEASAAASSAAALAPLLIRMLNGSAGVLSGIAEELQSLQWLVGQLQNEPALPTAVSPITPSQHYCASPRYSRLAAAASCLATSCTATAYTPPILLSHRTTLALLLSC